MTVASLDARLRRIERHMQTRIVHQRVGDVELTRVEGDPTTLNTALVERVATLERRLVAVDRLAECRREALDGLLTRYLDLIDSGDCGFWEPREEPVVHQALAARDAHE